MASESVKQERKSEESVSSSFLRKEGEMMIRADRQNIEQQIRKERPDADEQWVRDYAAFMISSTNEHLQQNVDEWLAGKALTAIAPDKEMEITPLMTLRDFTGDKPYSVPYILEHFKGMDFIDALRIMTDMYEKPARAMALLYPRRY